MPTITLAQASRIVDEALSKGRALGAAPLTVAVLDPGGHLVAVKREDESALLRPQIAIGKAWGALALGAPSRAIGQVAAERPLLFAALSDMSQGRIVPVPGGVLVHDASGSLVGAVGVSGDSSEIDEECAEHGVTAAGLEPRSGRT